MGLILVFLNAVAYFLLFYYSWWRYKAFSIYTLLTFLYAFTAVMCFLHYIENAQEYPNIGLLAFIYLFVAIVLFLVPVKTFYTSNKIFKIVDNKYFYGLALIFIGFAFYDIITSFSHTEEIIQSGAYNELRNQGYVDSDSVELYSDQYQRFAKNVASYLKPFAVVYAFFQLTKPRIKKIFVIALFVSIIAPSFIGAVADASRGMIIGVVLQLVVGYSLFMKHIPSIRRIYFYLGGIIVLFGFAAYTIAVTISRFGDESSDSVFFYLGHSMLVFNDGLFYNMTQYSWGGKFLDYFIEMFNWQSVFPKAVGATHPKAFCTFVGSLFTDFGPIGTLCVAILAQLVVNPFFRKKKIAMSDCVIIVFYCTTLANGIMVSPRGRALAWLMTFVVYFIVKYLETRNKTILIKRESYA